MDYYSSESEVQQSSMSKSLSLNVDVLPQKCHKSKALSLQFHEQDSSSTQSTDQSYPEVGSAQSGIQIETLSIYTILRAYELVYILSFCSAIGVYIIFPIVKLQ